MLIYRRVERISEAGDLILDIGAKGGTNITNTKADVVAIDLEFSRSMDDDSTIYLYGDGRQLPFRKDSFDFVVLNQVIEHVNGRPALYGEIARVLKITGTALFSFPNRFAFNKPHNLPRWLSIFPKPIGRRIAEPLLDDQQNNYYSDGVFPLSPIGARLELRNHFECIRYITVDESLANREIYSDRFAAQFFIRTLPMVAVFTQFTLFRVLFELIWGYVSYECNNPTINS